MSKTAAPAAAEAGWLAGPAAIVRCLPPPHIYIYIKGKYVFILPLIYTTCSTTTRRLATCSASATCEVCHLLRSATC